MKIEKRNNTNYENSVIYSLNGCDATVDIEDTHWYLIDIETKPESRRKGYARKVMTQIITDAQEASIDLKLEISPFGDKPMDKIQLKKFYESLGFIEKQKEMIYERSIKTSSNRRLL